MASFVRVLCILPLSGLVSADCPRDCPSYCPAQYDIQSSFVRQKFDLNNFWGTYYEIAYHDNTQPATWPIAAQCMRSVKSPRGGQNYKDLFSLNFGPFKGVTAVCDLEFNITDMPGVFMGHWSQDSRPDLHSIRNTVVDVGVAENGTYTWSLEFQCADNDQGIHFAAVNFYHRNPVIPKGEFDSMLERLQARGLGWIVNVSPGLKMVNQEKCIRWGAYPALDAAPYLCGQTPGPDTVV